MLFLCFYNIYLESHLSLYLLLTYFLNALLMQQFLSQSKSVHEFLVLLHLEKI